MKNLKLGLTALLLIISFNIFAQNNVKEIKTFLKETSLDVDLKDEFYPIVTIGDIFVTDINRVVDFRTADFNLKVKFDEKISEKEVDSDGLVFINTTYFLGDELIAGTIHYEEDGFFELSSFSYFDTRVTYSFFLY
jgi:hypothetical protein